MNDQERIEYFMSEIARLSNQVVDLQNERDALAAQVTGLSKANSKLAHLANQQGRINQLEAALDCLQFAAHLNAGACQNLDRVLADTLVVHNNAPEEMPSSCLAQIRVEAVQNFANEFCEDCVTEFQRTLSDKANRYAAKVREG